MARLALFGFLLAITTIGVYSWIVRRSCLDYAVFSYIRKNAVLHGLLIKTFKNKSPEECEAECIDENFCKSINTENGGDRTCELNIETEADTTANLTLTRKTGWTFKSTSYSDQLVGEICKLLKPCPAHHLCMDSCSCPGYECHKCRGMNIGINCLTQIVSGPLGLQDNRIKDYQITESSYSMGHQRGYKARLHAVGQWCGLNDNKPSYIRIDFPKRKIITDIAVQAHDSLNGGVTRYQLDFTEAMNVWKTYAEDGVVKTFDGTATRNDVVKQSLQYYVRAFAIKLRSLFWVHSQCMRIELYGIEDAQQPTQTTDCANYERPLGMESRTILDNQLTASTMYGGGHGPYNARLRWNTEWCSIHYDARPYLQVDFETKMIVTAVATQGRPTTEGWTKTYKISYGDNKNGPFTLIGSGGTDKIFTGNIEKDAVVKNPLPYPIQAQVFRLIPVTNFGFRWCIRMELYGCNPVLYA